MSQVNMSLRIDAELKDAFMAAAKNMDRNGSQLIRDFMRQTVERQHNAWFREQVEAGRQQLERGEVLPHDMVEASAAAWRDEMMKKAAGK
ncbi:TPA: type II toxin-antitoxin system antitoxin YacA [Salmonella enterica subsp. enterica serovar Strathcona]